MKGFKLKSVNSDDSGHATRDTRDRGMSLLLLCDCDHFEAENISLQAARAGAGLF